MIYHPDGCVCNAAAVRGLSPGWDPLYLTLGSGVGRLPPSDASSSVDTQVTLRSTPRWIGAHRGGRHHHQIVLGCVIQSLPNRGKDVKGSDALNRIAAPPIPLTPALFPCRFSDNTLALATTTHGCSSSPTYVVSNARCVLCDSTVRTLCPGLCHQMGPKRAEMETCRVCFTDHRTGHNVGFLEFVYVLGALGAKEHDTTQAEHSFVWRLLDLEDAGNLSRVGPRGLTRVVLTSLADSHACCSRALFCSQTEIIQRLKSVLTHVQVRERNHVRSLSSLSATSDLQHEGMLGKNVHPEPPCPPPTGCRRAHLLHRAKASRLDIQQRCANSLLESERRQSDWETVGASIHASDSSFSLTVVCVITAGLAALYAAHPKVFAGAKELWHVMKVRAKRL